MFCQKCGNQIPDGSVACNFCGAPQQAQTPLNNAVNQPVQPVTPSPAQNVQNAQKNKTNILLIVLIAVLAVGVIIGAIFIANPDILDSGSSSSQSGSKSNDDDEDDDFTPAEKALNSELKNIKKTKGASLYEEAFDEGSFDYLSAEQEEAMLSYVAAIIGNLDYEIVSSEEIDDETVEVTVIVETADAEQAMEIYMDLAEEYERNNDVNSLSEEELTLLIMSFFEEAFSDPDLEKVKSEEVIEMNLVDDKWEIADMDEFVNIITGDIESAMEIE